MEKILREKLEKIQNDLEKERRELKNIFFKTDGILERKKDEILIDWQKEKDIFKKYNKNHLEMLDYIVKLNFALRDLNFILLEIKD